MSTEGLTASFEPTPLELAMDNSGFIVTTAVDALGSLHAYTGLPWWGTITLTTIGLRLLITPLLVKQMRNAAVMQILQPEMAKLKAMQSSRGASQDRMQNSREMQELMSKYGSNPFAALGPALIQMPVFFTGFTTLRSELLPLRFPEVCNEGLLWFQDLSQVDSSMYLPVLSSLTFILMFEVNSLSSGTVVKPVIRGVMYTMMGGMLVISKTMPAAVLVFWLASSITATAQMMVLRIPPVARLCSIPESVGPDAAANYLMFLQKKNAPIVTKDVKDQKILSEKPKKTKSV